MFTSISYCTAAPKIALRLQYALFTNLPRHSYENEKIRILLKIKNENTQKSSVKEKLFPLSTIKENAKPNSKKHKNVWSTIYSSTLHNINACRMNNIKMKTNLNFAYPSQYSNN